MRIAESLLEEFFAEKVLIKPEISIGNYRLKWDVSSYGIPQTEVSELKVFLRDILPYISGAFFKAAGQISTTIKEEVGDVRKARKIQDSFSPELLLSRRRAECAYTLQMRQDGTTIIKRSETVTTTAEAADRKQMKVQAFQLDFLLGELVFIR